MFRALDVNHLGVDRVICAYERDGVIVDPGPESSIDALDGVEPRAILLTHIHLDHAGGTGKLVQRHPRTRVYVHERGARHLIDPSGLLKSAGQLYGDQMQRLWGEILPVPAENVTIVSGGETVEGLKVAYTPGHASHHVSYFDPETGEALTGDVAGVRIPPTEFVLPPTPPPDVDVEKWLDSIETLEAWGPSALCLTHAGRFTDVAEHLDRLRTSLIRHAEYAEKGDREAFDAFVDRERVGAAGGDEELERRLKRASPPDHLWLGLERYWRKRREREEQEAA